MLYFRTFITMLVSLFTVRVVFNALGVVDYGIQNVVAGFVSMLSFITGSLSVAFSRFYSIELGKEDYAQLQKTFSASLSIVFIVALIMVVIIEICGVYFVNYHMNMPADRVYAANWAFQFSVFTLFVNTISTPYDALIISREKMSAYAYISIFDVALKLAIAIALLYSTVDNLILYTALLAVQSLIVRYVYSRYCGKRFEEAKFSFSGDKKLIKEIAALAGWDLWGSSSYVLKNYGVNLLINIFCGAAVNAARGIAIQINSALSKFSNGFLTALRPQITKAYISESREHLFKMVDGGTKFACFLMLLLSMPIMVECHYVIKLWLGEVPEYTVPFSILIIIATISEGSLIYCQNTALMATGKIRKCQFLTGLIQLMNIPLSWLLLKLGFDPTLTIVIAIVISQITCFIRVSILHALIGYPISSFVTKVYIRIIAVALLAAVLPIIIKMSMDQSFARLMVITVVSLIWTSLLVYLIGCDKAERGFVTSKIRRIIKR